MHTAKRSPATIATVKMSGALLALMTAANAATAGDYSHQCRSAGGYFTMNDEALYAVDVAKGTEIGPEIKYKVLRKIVLAKNAGYCIANKAPKGQRKFKYAGQTYALQITFRQNGQSLTTFMLCELASSGLPAAYNCDREVKTLDWVMDR